jgi:hypothetical protein
VNVSQDCTFNRVHQTSCHLEHPLTYSQVNSYDAQWKAPVEPIPSSTNVSDPALPSSYPSTTGSSSRYDAQALHRPSLPTLHTRSVFPSDAESQYEASPIDMYTFASSTIPRQESFSSNLGVENYRSWSTSTGPMTATAATAAYDPNSGISYAAMPGPYMPQPQHSIGRLPSVTADTFSSLNMGHLNASLPAHRMHERSLPIPPRTQEVQHTAFNSVEVPEIRPLALHSEPRAHIHGIHSRSALPWAIDSASAPPMSVSTSSYAPPNEMPTGVMQTTTALAEPVLGYQFPIMGANDSEISQASGLSLAETYPSVYGASGASMLPPPGTRYATCGMSGAQIATADDHIDVTRSGSAALYSFSTHRADSEAREQYERGTSMYSGPETVAELAQPAYAASFPYRQRRSSGSKDRDGTGRTGHNAARYSSATIHHPRPQHTASIESLYRRSSLEHSPLGQRKQPRRESHDDHERRRQSSTAQSRMSISTFNAPY